MFELNHFGKSNVKSEIIGASALLYPVLADFGAGMETPVLVYVDGADGLQAFLNAVQCFGLPPVHSLGEAPKRFRQVFYEDNLGVVVIRYTRSRYSLQNLEEVAQYCSSFLDLENRALVFIVADQFVPECFLQYFGGSLYFSTPRDCSNPFEKSEFLKNLVDSVVLNQKQLRAEINDIVDTDDDGIALFSAAVACIKMAMLSCGYAKESVQAFGEVAISVLEEIREHWEMSCDPEAYVEAFVRRLSEEIISGLYVPTILDHYHVLANDCNKIGFANYYDEKAYYFNKEFFEWVCAPLAEQVGMEFLKQQLASAGLLECGKGKRNYYTSKVEVVTEYGFVKRMHRVKIYRNVLEKNVDVSFVDLILLRKEEDENEAEGNLLGEHDWAE